MNPHEDLDEFVHGEYPDLPTLEILAKEMKLHRTNEMRQTVAKNKNRNQTKQQKHERPGAKAKIRIGFIGDIAIILSLPLTLLTSLGALLPRRGKNQLPKLPPD
jgi:hypothetical protein